MKQYKYRGGFKSVEGHTYILEVNCNSFLQAFFLLTADAIRGGRHYQLDAISDENGNVKFIADILKCSELFS
jgi:hypothetical protein